MRKRIFTWLLALALVLTLLPAQTAAAASFSDVKGSDWYSSAVTWAVEKGITSGTTSTTFSPNATCSNAQILTFLWRAAGEPASNAPNPFRNISASDYYYKPVLWASEKNMITGTSFDAAANCTRAMAVTYIWKAQDMPFSRAPASFTDVPATNYELSIPVAWAVENGITAGTGSNTFSPDKSCTRAEIVTFLQRAYGGATTQTGSLRPTMPTTTTPSTGVQSVQMDARYTELLKLINEERAKSGLTALVATDGLMKAAKTRSAEISQGYFDNRPNGSGYETVLDENNVAATYIDETMAGGSSEAAGIFKIMMNTQSAYEAIHNGSLTHIGMGYTYNGSYGDVTDFWSVIYITAPASSTPSTPSIPTTSTTPSTGSSSGFTPVPMKELANLKSIQKKATDEQLAQAYNAALEIVRPLAGLSREEQLQGIAAAIRAMFDSGMDYSMTAEHYNDPYGYFILGAASCAGCTRATGLCLNILGIPYEHVNENQNSHQWCRVNVGNTYWICDAYGLYCGAEPSPYTHPYF